MTFKPRSNHPYAHAPRLPDGNKDDRVAMSSLFAATGPIELEIGPGRGGFMFERAAARPEALLLGFEIRMKWSALVDQRLAKAGLGARARVLNGDAKEALQRLDPDALVEVVYLHFPDPWWKKRHEKRLVMSPVLLDAVARLLKDRGELFVQTDVEDRAAEYDAQIAAHSAFEPAGDAEGSARLAENPYRALSPREHHAIADGLPIHRIRYRRRAR